MNKNMSKALEKYLASCKPHSKSSWKRVKKGRFCRSSTFSAGKSSALRACTDSFSAIPYLSDSGGPGLAGGYLDAFKSLCTSSPLAKLLTVFSALLALDLVISYFVFPLTQGTYIAQSVLHGLAASGFLTACSEIYAEEPEGVS